MPKISFSSKGSFDNVEVFLKRMSRGEIFKQLEAFGAEGVAALSVATPLDSGKTARSWTYKVTQTFGHSTITWSNTHIENGVSIAIILQYGHGTGTGGYVEGRDYINPAIKPIFDKIADRTWKAVTSA